MGRQCFCLAIAGIVAFGVRTGLAQEEALPVSIPDDTSVGTWDDGTRTYTLTTNVGGSLRISQDDLSVDGAGHSVRGAGIGAGVLIVERTGVTIKNLTVEGFDVGIDVGLSNFSKLTGNTVSGNATGIRVVGVVLNDNYITMTGNTITGNSGPGVVLAFSSHNTLKGNDVRGNGAGIMLFGPESPIFYCSSNLLTENTVDENSAGVLLAGAGCTGNQVYRNSFIHNKLQAVDTDGGNTFGKAAPVGGNYWDDWAGPDRNADGFGEAHYTFPGGEDQLPLVRPPEPSPAPVEPEPPAPVEPEPPAPVEPEPPPEDPKPGLIYPRNLTYRGFFHPPRLTGDGRWGYGGHALAYCEERDSLFGAGHAHFNLVGEMKVPATLDSEVVQLQPFVEITSGEIAEKRSELGLDGLGGLAIISGKLYWNFFRYYAVQSPTEIDDPTHGWSTLDLSAPAAGGLFHVGPIGQTPFHQKMTANYMCEIPSGWASRHVSGYRLATGKGDGAGNAGVSHGPALFAVDHNYGGLHMSDAVAATALLYYPPEHTIGDWSAADRWEAAAWLESNDSAAVIFIGLRGRGETWYGYPEGPIDPPPDWDSSIVDECGGTKGYHSDRYEVEMRFYNPQDLAEVAAGVRPTYGPTPYATRILTEFQGECGRVGACAFDRRGGRLFVWEPNGEDPYIHVYTVE